MQQAKSPVISFRGKISSSSPCRNVILSFRYRPGYYPKIFQNSTNPLAELFAAAPLIFEYIFLIILCCNIFITLAFCKYYNKPVGQMGIL